MPRLRILTVFLILMAVCQQSNGYFPTTIPPTSSTTTTTWTTPRATSTGTTKSGTSSSGTATTSSNGTTGTTTGPGNSCIKSKYRTIDGSCSNADNPSSGQAGQPFGRMIPPNYADGVSLPAIMSNGSAYVSTRPISFNLFSIAETDDPSNSLLNYFILQAIGIDLSLPSGSFDVVTCCTNGQVTSNPPARCLPVAIPANDPIYSWFNILCLNYARVLTTPSQAGQPVQQINDASSSLDLSFLYGTSLAQSNNLRTLSGGRLKAVRRNGVEWPVIDPAGCDWADLCYLVADRRSYQFPMSATVHLLFLREHNRLANQLKLVNPLWSDEVLFQEARRINIAQYQSIVYYEYLPRVLGRTNMLTNRLIYDGTGFSTDFNKFQNPATLAEFIGVVLPFMASQIPGSINFYNSDGTIQSTRLSGLTGSLSTFEATFSSFFAGLTTQDTRLVDTSFSIEWKNFMYRGNATLGQDLLALDMQRMRDFGFGRYNDYRLRSGLGRVATWEAFNATMKAPCYETINRLQSIYATVDDIELFVGAAFEKPLPGSVLGPTFSFISQLQFLTTRTGDRYFFEAGGQDGSFSAAQLAEIRKVKLSRLMCNSFPTTSSIQADVLSPVSDTNPLVACSTLPGLDASLFV